MKINETLKISDLGFSRIALMYEVIKDNIKTFETHSSFEISTRPVLANGSWKTAVVSSACSGLKLAYYHGLLIAVYKYNYAV